MKNNNVFNVSGLHNPDIISTAVNFDFLSHFMSDFCCTVDCPLFSAVGFDFDDNHVLRQIQPFEGYGFVEVLHEVQSHPDVYGKEFCIFYHDLCGFHYLIY